MRSTFSGCGITQSESHTLAQEVSEKQKRSHLRSHRCARIRRLEQTAGEAQSSLTGVGVQSEGAHVCPVRRARYSTREVLPLLVGPCQTSGLRQANQASASTESRRSACCSNSMGSIRDIKEAAHIRKCGGIFSSRNVFASSQAQTDRGKREREVRTCSKIGCLRSSTARASMER